MFADTCKPCSLMFAHAFKAFSEIPDRLIIFRQTRVLALLLMLLSELKHHGAVVYTLLLRRILRYIAIVMSEICLEI